MYDDTKDTIRHRDYVNSYFMICEIMEFDYETNNLTVRTCYRNMEDPMNQESVILNCFFSEMYLQNEELINKLNVGTFVIIEGSLVEINGSIKIGIKRIKFLQKNRDSWDNE